MEAAAQHRINWDAVVVLRAAIQLQGEQDSAHDRGYASIYQLLAAAKARHQHLLRNCPPSDFSHSG